MLIKFLKDVNLDGVDYTTESGEKAVTDAVGASLITAGYAGEVIDYNWENVASEVAVTVNDLAEASATANRVALQGALDIGGIVSLPSGITYIDKVVTIGKNTHLTGPKDARLELVSGPNGAGWTISTLTSSGTTATITTSADHNLPVSTMFRMIVVGVTPAGYNGLWDVTITGAKTATYTLVASLSGVAGSALAGANVAGAVAGSMMLLGPYEEYGYCGNVIRNRNWASAKCTLSNFTVGSQTIIGQTPVTFTTSVAMDWVAGDSIQIRGDTTDAWNGTHEVISYSGTTLTVRYKAPSTRVPTPSGTLTAQAEDANIKISGITVAGGQIRLSSDPSWESHSILINNASRLRVEDVKVIDTGKYAISLSNTIDTVADMQFDTGSDGFHLNGGNKNLTLRNLHGNSSDDIIALTANDPTGVYPFNRYPTNEGFTSLIDGLTIGYIKQDGGLDGASFQDVHPSNQQARILLSGIATETVSGIVIDGYRPKFNNLESTQAEIDAGRNAGAICICAEPYNSTTTYIDDVTIRDWRIGGAKIGPHLAFYDVQVNGPYTGQLVLNKLTLDNVSTQRTNPLTSVGAAATQKFIEMSGTQTRWSIGSLVIQNSTFDLDATGSEFSLIDINPQNPNSEYINQIVFSNCRFVGVSGNWGVNIVKFGGVGGANTGKVKSILFENCTFEFESAAGGHMYPVVISPSANLSYKPKIVFDSCRFIRVTCALSCTRNAAMVITNCFFDTVESGGILLLGNAAAVVDLIWSNNYTNSQTILALTGAATVNVLKADETFAVDLSKLSVAGSKGSIARSLSTTGGTIVDGNLCVSDGTNWRQLTDPSKLL